VGNIVGNWASMTYFVFSLLGGGSGGAMDHDYQSITRTIHFVSIQMSREGEHLLIIFIIIFTPCITLFR